MGKIIPLQNDLNKPHFLRHVEVHVMMEYVFVQLNTLELSVDLVNPYRLH